MKTACTITVAVPTLNRATSAEMTLARVLSTLTHHVVQIIVVDQSDAETNHRLRCGIEKLATKMNANTRIPILHVSSSNRSLTAARNSALLRASGEVVTFLDDDVLVCSGFFQAISMAFSQNDWMHAMTGQVYQRILPADGMPPPSPDDPTVGTQPHFVVPENQYSRETIEWTGTVIGCNHSVRRSSAIIAHGYDENIVGYGEDDDFSYRIRRRFPNSIGFCKDAWLVHLRHPEGGCRLNRNPAHTEREKTRGLFILKLRHPTSISWLQTIAEAFRRGPLRSENRRSALSILIAFSAMIAAGFEAARCRHSVRSPFA